MSNSGALVAVNTDGKGVIQLFYSGGRFVPRHDGAPIADLLPVLSDVFSSDGDEYRYSDGYRLYATRLRLGEDTAQSQAEVGIVVQVSD